MTFMLRAMTAPALATNARLRRLPPLRGEVIETIKLSFPIALTQLGEIAMMTTDLAMIGRLGDAAIAAAALGQIVLFVAFVAGLGIISAVAPLAAQAYGAREPRMVRRALRVGLWVAVLLGVPLTFVQMHGETLLLLAGQEPKSAALAQQYLFGLGWSIVPAWSYMAFRNFMSAVNRPVAAAIPLNAFLAFGLINGAFGMPRLGILGAGVATTIVNVVMCLSLVWMCYAMRPFKKYRVLGKFWRFDRVLFEKLLVVGLPISAGYILEVGLFAGAGLLMGWIGTEARIRSRFRSPRSSSWCRSESRWRQACASGRRQAGMTPPRRAAQVSSRSYWPACSCSRWRPLSSLRAERFRISFSIARQTPRRLRSPRRSSASARVSSRSTACKRWVPAPCAA